MALTTKQNPPVKLRNPQPSRDALDEMSRDKIVMVRLTAEERDAWQAAADADQRKLADWIRVVVNASLKSEKKARR